MCNACHNVCCGSDEFYNCGCDGCDEPDCWSPDDEETDYGELELARCGPARSGGFVCEELPLSLVMAGVIPLRRHGEPVGDVGSADRQPSYRCVVCLPSLGVSSLALPAAALVRAAGLFFRLPPALPGLRPRLTVARGERRSLFTVPVASGPLLSGMTRGR